MTEDVDLEAWEMEKTNSIQGVKPDLQGFELFSQWYLDVFRVHNRVNVFILFGMMIFYILVFALMFKKALVSIYHRLCGENGVVWNEKPPVSFGENSGLRSAFESFNFLWAVLSIIVTMPYSRLTGSHTFLCFWSWCTMMFITVPAGLYNTPAMRKFILKYVMWFSFGVMSTANWAYFYYGFHNGQWDYLIIHMGPPVWAFIWVLVNIRDFDDDVNSLLMNPIVFALIQSYYLICIGTWRYFNIPHIVYSMFHMENLYFYGTVFPIGVNAVFLMIFCIARAIWCRCQDKHVENHIKTD